MSMNIKTEVKIYLAKISTGENLLFSKFLIASKASVFFGSMLLIVAKVPGEL